MNKFFHYFHKSIFKRFLIKVCFLLATVFSPVIFALVDDVSYVSSSFHAGDFALVKKGERTTVYVDANDYSGVLRAVSNLEKDIEKVTSVSVGAVNEIGNSITPNIIVGTLGKSQVIDSMVANGKLNLGDLKDRWEGFIITLVDKPFEGADRALVIAGSDKRGTIYGVYDLAEKIGVSPWYWWADVPVKKSQELYVKDGTYIEQSPVVKYRGIFLNDEAPALTGWVQEKYGNYNSQFYENVFELLLRLKANYLWPAMWNNAFNQDDPENRKLANEMGIVMGTSHHEPMNLAHKEWVWADKAKKGNQKWDYSSNEKALYTFWKEGVEADKPYESITTLGMRGDGDRPMSEDDNIHLLEKIVTDQREILSQVYERDAAEIPQVWTLYKEVQGYYEKGMRVPDDVTLLWADDNWGNIRRLPTAQERNRSGGAGVYYHFDYVGEPRSYRWINTIPIAKVWEQMNLAYHYGANTIWITNVGDLKPMEFPIDFFLRMAWNPEAFTRTDIQAFGQHWAARQFGEQYASTIEKLITGYTRHNSRRKPELMEAGTYSQINYYESERIAAELQDLVDQAEAISKQLPESHKDAFFQLVLYPVKATANIFNFYDALAKNRLFAEQERNLANVYAERVKALFQEHKRLVNEYHNLGNGRWNQFMSQPVFGYSYWDNPKMDTLPVLHINSPQPVAEMGVAVEGRNKAWPQDYFLSMDRFTPYGQAKRYIDIYNKGTKPYTYKAEKTAPWITLSETDGDIVDQKRLWVSIDWSLLPAGESTGKVLVHGTNYDAATITVVAFKPADESIKGFVETDGYVSIEAASATIHNGSDKAYWAEIPQHGRTQSSMSAFSVPDFSVKKIKKGPYLEYPFHIFEAGDISINVLTSPSLNFVPGRGLRFALSIDNRKPVVLDILADNSKEAWSKAVSDGVRQVAREFKLSKAGNHTLRVYMVDPGVVIQKIIIDRGGLKPSYLGPPQSSYIP